MILKPFFGTLDVWQIHSFTLEYSQFLSNHLEYAWYLHTALKISKPSGGVGFDESILWHLHEAYNDRGAGLAHRTWEVMQLKPCKGRPCHSQEMMAQTFVNWHTISRSDQYHFLWCEYNGSAVRYGQHDKTIFFTKKWTISTNIEIWSCPLSIFWHIKYLNRYIADTSIIDHGFWSYLLFYTEGTTLACCRMVHPHNTW